MNDKPDTFRRLARDRTPWIAALCIFLAVGAFVTAGLMQDPIAARHKEYELVPAEAAMLRSRPDVALMSTLPGGLRALAVNYLWIRAQSLMREGRHFDAYQLASMICKLQPHFDGVWSFHAWNMAYNISVATHTPEERWRWVSNGMRLLRDEGIPLNPRALVLYKELSWIFFHKIGGSMDEMHMAYKRRWAREMQRVLGAPPPGSTAAVLRWFAPVARYARDYVDRDPGRRGRETIQADQLRRLLAENPAARKLANAAREEDVELGQELLDVWSRYSESAPAQHVRAGAGLPEGDTERDERLHRLVNDAELREGMVALLGFLRAQILWNDYRMDPAYMHELMQEFGPLDWRLPWPHGLYWAHYGMKKCGGEQMTDVDALNNERNILNCLKLLTWNGRLAYVENPRNPDEPYVRFYADWRFIEPTHREHKRLIALKDQISRNTRLTHEPYYLSGHVNYLISAIEMLYAGYRRDEAQRYLDYIQTDAGRTGPEWDLPLDEFVYTHLFDQGQILPEMAANQVTISLQTAFLLNAKGKPGGKACLQHAQRVHARYNAEANPNVKLPPFWQMGADNLAMMLAEPAMLGYHLPLLDRARLYRNASEDMKRIVYDRIAGPLKAQCPARDVDFDQWFPEPEGMAELRKRRDEARLAPGEPEASDGE